MHNSATVQQNSVQQLNKYSVLHWQTNIKVTQFQRETNECKCVLMLT